MINLGRLKQAATIESINNLAREAANPPRNVAEAKQQVITESSTRLLRGISDSAVGKALKAIAAKVS